MSKIDSTLDPGLRSQLLSEVRSLLPAFLSAASVERGGPVNAATELLALPASDLRRVLAVHTMLSQPVRELVDAIPLGMRRPITSSVRPRVAGRTVTSGIDWAATVRHRASSSPLGDIWVTRPANRVFDIPENRALAWVLKVLAARSVIAVPPTSEPPGAWGAEIREMSATIRKSRETAWLEGVPPEWPGNQVYSRLSADRTGFYHNNVSAAARYLRRYVVSPTAEDVAQAICSRYFEPRQDWKLFEIAVLMRICRSLSDTGTRVSTPRMFHDGRAGPFACFRIGGERQVRIWYQSWPSATAPSELDDAVRHYELASSGNRPDIVVEILVAGVSRRAIILELKASASGSYLSSGLGQLLGYLRDRPRLTAKPASGWLVAPAGTSFISKPADGRSLWMTTADRVAANIISELTSGSDSRP